MAWKPTKLLVFEPVHRCIYCGTLERRLGREHVVPSGLGGRIILPKASCISDDQKNVRSCSDITKEIEQACLRRMLGPLRVRLDMPTNSPHERPKRLKVRAGVFDDDRFEYTTELEVPWEDFPRTLVLPILPLPRIMTNVSTVNDWGGDLWSSIDLDDLNAFQEKYGLAPEIAAVNPLLFFRMIAKIAHSWTVGAEGIDGFRPLLLDLILGRSDIVGDLIGSVPCAREPQPHNVSTHFHNANGTNYVACNVRLFGDLGAPFSWSSSASACLTKSGYTSTR